MFDLWCHTDRCYKCGNVSNGKYVSKTECGDDVIRKNANFETEICVDTKCAVRLGESLKLRLVLSSLFPSIFSRAVTTRVNTDLNVYSAFARLDLVSPSDNSLVCLFMPACAPSSN